jgi:hypothetical protein
MTRRENLRKLNEAIELRLKKLDEIREFLAISVDADDQDMLGIMTWWQKTAA